MNFSEEKKVLHRFALYNAKPLLIINILIIFNMFINIY